MKKLSGSFVLLIIILLLQPGGILLADLFLENVPRSVFHTEHFDIIFTEESRADASRLAGFADDLYREITDLLGVEADFRNFPVVMAGDTDILNGYFTVYPSRRIVLYRAPISVDSGFARYNDGLYKLFLHELVHAVSLMQTGPLWEAARTVLGDPVSPGIFASSPAFVEGITVSLESLDGFGRAADSPYAALIIQDLIEGRARHLMETPDTRDPYPSGLWYVYGGWFNRYLIEHFGLDAYADFWKLLGRGRTAGDFLFFKGAFHSSFGMPLPDAWDDFLNWMQEGTLNAGYQEHPWMEGSRLVAPSRPESSTNDGYMIYTGIREVSSDLRRVLDMDSAGGILAWADDKGIWIHDSATQLTRRLAPADGAINRIALSPRGDRLLVSTARPMPEGQFRAAIRLLDSSSGSDRSDELPSVMSEGEQSFMEADFGMDDSYLAIRIDGYSGDLVRIEADGEMEIIFPGETGYQPSAPAENATGLYFLLGDAGINRPVRFDGSTGLHFLIEAQDDFESMQGIRHISLHGSGLVFSFGSGSELPRMGIIKPDSSIMLQTGYMSGGMQHPVLLESTGDANDTGVVHTILYAGYFSDGMRILPLPPGHEPSHNLENIHQIFQHDGQTPARLFTPEYEGSLAAAQIPVQADTGTAEITESPYRLLPALFSAGYRYPLVELAPSVSYPERVSETEETALIGSLGLGAEFLDPGESLGLTAELAYNWEEGFLPYSLSLSSYMLPFSIQLMLHDHVSYSPASAYEDLRIQGLVLSGFSYIPGSFGRTTFNVGAQASLDRYFIRTTAASPYGWDPVIMIGTAEFSAGMRNIRTDRFSIMGSRGYELEARPMIIVPGYYSSADNGFLPVPEDVYGILTTGTVAYLPFLNTRIGLEAIGSLSPGLQTGLAGSRIGAGLTVRNPNGVLHGEYADIASYGDWLTYGQLSWGYPLPLETPLGNALYLSALNIQLGGRASLGGGSWEDLSSADFLGSAFASGSLELHFNFGGLSSIPFTLGAEFRHAFNRPADEAFSWVPVILIGGKFFAP